MAVTAASELPSRAAARGPLIGVLALQGDFQAHERVLQGLSARVREVRVPEDLQGLAGIVIPGGESTTMMLGIQREGLAEPLRQLVRAGCPVLGSCAGLIMLDREHLALMDISAKRNAFGRQIKSFEADIDVRGIAGGPLRGVFIRAPWIAEHGPDVEILAEVEGHAVAAREGRMLAVAFHSELGEDDRIHRLFLEQAHGFAARAGGSAGAQGSAAAQPGGAGGAARSSAPQP
jgi:pyridoxal 5'-phosphate synthase pdxT subunit